MKEFIQMKKIIMLLCLGLTIYLSGCGESTPPPKNNTSNNNKKNIIEIVKVIEFENNEGIIDGYELRNLTDKTITALKGDIMFCDEFGDATEAKRIRISDPLAPHSSIAYCRMVIFGQGELNFKGSSLDKLDGCPVSLNLIPGKDISKATVQVSRVKYSN